MQAKEEPEITVTAAIATYPVPNSSDQLVRDELSSQGFPPGLSQGLMDNVNHNFALRIWVLDNSGSMMSNDGNRFVLQPDGTASLSRTTRWRELVDNVDYHARLAALMGAPTLFRFLNNPGSSVGPQQFGVADNMQTVDQDLARAIELIHKAQPEGYTPLLLHVKEITNYVKSIEQNLIQDGKRVVVVLATDGVPTDARNLDELAEHLKILEKLPVWLIFRLYTGEDKVIEYYNDIDKKLEKPCDNLDDFESEAREVWQANPWINYTLMLHRAREMGFRNKLFDLIDERPFTKDEVKEYIELIFGPDPSMPDPAVNFEMFISYVEKRISSAKNQYNPMLRQMGPWIDTNQLRRAHGLRVHPTRSTVGNAGDGCCVIS